LVKEFIWFNTIELGQGLKVETAPPLFYEQGKDAGITEQLDLVYFSAAYYFTRCAMESIEVYSHNAVLEDETDPTVNLRQVLETVMRLYGVIDIEKFMRFMSTIRTVAFKRGLPWNDRLQAWLDSGGYAYNEVTREESTWNTDR
jgi:hypothetical protein